MEARYAREIAMAKRSLMDENQLNIILERIKAAATYGETYMIVNQTISEETITKLKDGFGYSVDEIPPKVIPYEESLASYRISW